MRDATDRIGKGRIMLAGLVAIAGAVFSKPGAAADTPALVQCDRSQLAQLRATEYTATVVAFGSDLSRVWGDHLQPVSKQAAASAIVRPAAHSCLEHLAHGDRQRLAFRDARPTSATRTG